MSLIKWFIISSLVTLPLMFLLPPDQGLSGQDSGRALADLQFSDACNNAALQGCPLDAFRSVYVQCTTVYGNISLEQCKSICCDANATAIYNLSDFLNIPVQYIP